MAGGGAPHWSDVRWARHKSSAKPRKRCGCRLELITQRRVWLTADHALDRICLMVPVDAHLDRLFLFNWIRAKSGGHTTCAGAHRAHVHLAVEAISCLYRGRVRTFKFPSLLGLRTPIEGYSSHFIGHSGCFRRRSCGSINFRYSGFSIGQLPVRRTRQTCRSQKQFPPSSCEQNP